MSQREPAVCIRITAEGIVDENFWYSPGLVRWEQIVEIRSTALGFIEIDLEDDQAFWETLSPLKALARMKMQLLGYGPAFIVGWNLAGSIEDNLEAMRGGLDDFSLRAIQEAIALDSGETPRGPSSANEDANAG